MPLTNPPTASYVLFELGIYAVALFVLVTLWRKRPTQVALMLLAMVFAGALEVSDIRTTHSYHYARFLVMIGAFPDWFPLCIAVAWGLVLHSVMTATEQLIGSVWLRPPVAALLGVLPDLVLDPVVASSRVVAVLSDTCAQPGMPQGSALGIGFWVWCVPGSDHALIWGIPFPNFYAWGVVVLGYAGVDRALREVFDYEPDGALQLVGHALLSALIAFCVVDVGLQLYTPLVMRGVPQWALLLGVFGPGAWVLLRAGAQRVAETVSITSWLFPATALCFTFGAYLLAGVVGRGGLVFFVYVLLATALCALAYAFTLFGLPWRRVIAGKGGPAPSLSTLLADAPATAVSVSEANRVAALTDPVERNRLITQRYHDLSLDVARCIAGPNANWATFATWASKTAGESIRGQEVPPWVHELLRADEQVHAVLRRVREALDGDCPPEAGPKLDASSIDPLVLARATLQRVSDQVADGNRKVFAELAPLFARFVACFEPGKSQPRLDERAFTSLLDALRPGPTEGGGQALLREAFSAYRDASLDPDPCGRAQRMLLANCLVGLHEQTRLQSNIAAALDAPVDVPISDGLFARLSSLLPEGLQRDLELLFGPASAAAQRLSRCVWQHIATAVAMHIDLPEGAAIPLAQDVNTSLDEGYPAHLRELELPALQSLAERFGAAHGARRDLGASDWAQLDDRMRFIIDLFRTTQQDPRLFTQPFARAPA